MRTRKIKLTVFALLLSLVNLLLFHLPFFKYVSANVEADFNGFLITAGLAVLIFALNFLVSYLVIFLCRTAGKVIAGITFIISSVTLYFINTYDVIVDDTMMGNVFNTNYSEATSYFCLAAVLYVLFLGAVPCVLTIIAKINYGSVKRFFTNILIALAIVVAVAFGNMSNWPWIDKHAPVIGSLLMPWSYTVNAVRYKLGEAERNRKEILLPDASIRDDEKAVVVLVIGESDRRDHFSLYGYERQTNPLMSQIPDLKAFPAKSAATYTTAGVKAILDYQQTDSLYEILPNYLFRTGADVVWRASNWGEPPLHVSKYSKIEDLSDAPNDGPLYDQLLFDGVDAQILSSNKNKVLLVLHTSTSHGPSYYLKYPPQFEKFTPVAKSVEMSKCPRQEIVNAYDNTILYTDYLFAGLISTLKDVASQGWKCCAIFVGDHGESLGENDLYMHGVPISIAPKEQYEIPFIVWSSDPSCQPKADGEISQYHVFHTVLDFLHIDSAVYDKELDLFKK